MSMEKFSVRAAGLLAIIGRWRGAQRYFRDQAFHFQTLRVLPPRPTKTVLIGMSMGGYLAPRAAAFDRRIDGVVAFDVLYDFGALARQSVPPFAFWLHAHHAGAVLDAFIAIKARCSPGFAWSLANAQWVLGTASAIETVEALGRYTLAPVASRIKADVLILAGAEDHFIAASQAADFAQALTAARSVLSIVYDRASGGAAHCQMGAQSLWHADFFDWIERIGLSIGRGAAGKTQP